MLNGRFTCLLFVGLLCGFPAWESALADNIRPACLGMKESEGASTLVDRLDIKAVESMKRLKAGGIAMVASWDVYGSVSDSGHIHYRCNTYRAELTMVPTEDYWKLTGFQLLDEERVI
jgi:hypothetical protein